MPTRALLTRLHPEDLRIIFLGLLGGILFWVFISTLFGATAFIDWRRQENSYEAINFISNYALGFGAWIIGSPLVFLSSTKIGRISGDFWVKTGWSALLIIGIVSLVAGYVFLVIPALFGSHASANAAATPYLEWGWDIFIAITLFLAGVSRGHAMRLNENALENGRLRNVVLETQRDIVQFELDQIRHQFSSHFMLNAMHNIIGLIRAKRITDAEFAAELLSKILKRISNTTTCELIQVQDEMKAIAEYLNFQKIRYPNFKSSLQVKDNLQSRSIPRDLLQPLVENAFKHGMDNNGYLDLRVEVSREGSWLLVQVENSRPSNPDDSGVENFQPYQLAKNNAGNGLRIVQKRLQSLFPGSHALNFFMANEAFRVKIKLPWEN